MASMAIESWSRGIHAALNTHTVAMNEAMLAQVEATNRNTKAVVGKDYWEGAWRKLILGWHVVGSAVMYLTLPLRRRG